MITIDYDTKTLLMQTTSLDDVRPVPVYHLNAPGTVNFFDAHIHRNYVGCLFCDNPYTSHNIHRVEFTPAARKYLKNEKTLPGTAHYFVCGQCNVGCIFHPSFGAIATVSDACKKLANHINAIVTAVPV